jgi:hypothetical protein
MEFGWNGLCAQSFENVVQGVRVFIACSIPFLLVLNYYLIIYASEKRTYVYFLAQIGAFLFDALRHTSSQLTIPGRQGK